MIRQIELSLLPAQAFDKQILYQSAARKLKLNLNEISAVVPVKRSIDARSRQPEYKIVVDVYINEQPSDLHPGIKFEPVIGDKSVIIAGFGPAGMFAALRLIELGIKPIVIERGRDVRERRKDLRAIQQFGVVDPDSNYCFGEGGAGTYSDGKLYTRSTKRGDVKRILNLLVQHGAHEDILIDAHPHIGSNKLPQIVQAVRETILRNNGEIHFNSRLSRLILENNAAKGAVVNDREIFASAVILATGHSARDIFYMLREQNVKLEAKPFAMGVRIEHPQALIDEIQYHSNPRNPMLPAASYNFTCQADGRGVFSFCMCPGGIVIPASTAPGELVLNGMSVSRRDSKYANSGFVVTINEEQWKKYATDGEFAGLMLQKEIEKIAFEAGGRTQQAPAQRITDFVSGTLSTSLPGSSYIPGTVSSPLHELLPGYIAKPLREALIISGKKMKGYYTSEAQILAAETRTSSPVRIPRDRETLMHIDIKGLFPCGEGAGYAGGIVSAAIDGENCAAAAAKLIS